MDNTVQTINDVDNIEIARSFQCEPLKLKNNVQVKNNDFTVVSQNIRSIYRNFDDFLVTLSCFSFAVDVIVLTECRIDNDKILPTIPNYNMYYTKHRLNQNDGVVVYVKDTLKHKIKEIRLTEASCLELDILNNKVLCIYRSPSNTNAENFVNSLGAHLDSIHESNKNIIITGDININISLKTEEPPLERKNRLHYLDTLAMHGVLAGHTIPTREKNCLDHFMIKINKIKTMATIAVLPTSTTDHYTILMFLSKVKFQPIVNKTKIKINYEEALTQLKNKNLSKLLHCEDPDVVINGLIHALTMTIKENTIITSIPKRKRIIKPWITPGLLRCIRNRNELQMQSKRNPFNELIKITYIRYRNFCNNLLRKLKRNYEKELLANSVKNNKLLWKNIKHITYTNKSNSANPELLNIKSSPTQAADFVNECFVNIGKHLAQKIQPDPLKSSDYLKN